jgi:CheY-like chemotaxis protein
MKGTSMKKQPAMLIVEDNPEDQFILNRILAGLKDKYNLIVESTYDNAIQRIQDPSQKIELALVDIVLEDKNPKSFTPDHAISGLEILVELQEKFIPAIAISAYQDSDKVRDAFVKGGAKDFWFKDLDKNTYLLEAIKRIDEDYPKKDKDTASTNSITTIWYPVVAVIVGIIAILAVTTWVPQNDRLLAFSVLIALVVMQASITGLLLRRLTGKDFKEIISIFKPKWPF